MTEPWNEKKVKPTKEPSGRKWCCHEDSGSMVFERYPGERIVHKTREQFFEMTGGKQPVYRCCRCGTTGNVILVWPNYLCMRHYGEFMDRSGQWVVDRALRHRAKDIHSGPKTPPNLC